LQAIYGWINVDINTIFNVRDRLKAKVLPLPISYRCPKKVIELAKEFAPDIQAAPNAKEGEIRYIKESDLPKYVKPGDFVLSRSNAPLIKLCMLFFKLNIRSNIKGKDVADTLSFLIKLSRKKTVPSFLKWLEEWKNSEVERLTNKKKNISPVLDKYECLVKLSEGAVNLSDIESNIKKLFKNNDDENIVLLSNIHQCKGLQAKRVFILRKTFKPYKGQEEANLMYIALTRSQEYLIFVE
jgi:DNA helicase II / ATP-dependent DNA helicase PcrA